MRTGQALASCPPAQHRTVSWLPTLPDCPSSQTLLPAPLYARVKQMIAQQIRSGWPAHCVPSESELVEELGFSRMTINRALRELTAEGLLVRMQGVGTRGAARARRCSR